MSDPRPFPDPLRIGPWQRVPAEMLASWHDLRGEYVEHHWLPVLGPTTTFLLRRIGEGFEFSPAGFDLDVPALARSLGVAHRGGWQSPLARSVRRLVSFNLAHWEGSDILRVYRRVPAVPASFRSTNDGRLE